MSEYLVTWEMPFEAGSAVDAARQALGVHRDPGSIATVFRVELDDQAGHHEWLIDIEDPDEAIILEAL